MFKRKVRRYGRGIPRVRKPSFFQSAVFSIALGIYAVAVLQQGMTVFTP